MYFCTAAKLRCKSLQKRGEHTLGMKPNYLSAEYFFSMKQKTLFLDGGYPPYNQKAAKIFRRLFSGPRVGRFLDFGLWEQSSRHQQSTFGIMEKYNYDFNDHCIQYKIINCKIFSYSLNFFFKSIKIYMNMNWFTRFLFTYYLWFVKVVLFFLLWPVKNDIRI